MLRAWPTGGRDRAGAASCRPTARAVERRNGARREGSRPSTWCKFGGGLRWPSVRRPWVEFERLGVGGRRRQLGHGLELHVAVLQLPLVVLLQQHGADQADDRGLVGEDADDVGPALDLLVQALQRVGGVQLGRGAGRGRPCRRARRARSRPSAPASLGQRARSWSATCRQVWRAAAWSGCRKAWRSAAATMVCWPLGTWARALRIQ